LHPIQFVYSIGITCFNERVGYLYIVNDTYSIINLLNLKFQHAFSTFINFMMLNFQSKISFVQQSIVNRSKT